MKRRFLADIKIFSTDFWRWWLSLTLVYLFAQMIQLGPEASIAGIGLFVPIGIFNFLGALTVNPLAFLVVIVGIILGDYIIKKLKLKRVWDIITILVLLFLITFLVDITIWHQWCSGLIFIEPYHNSCSPF